MIAALTMSVVPWTVMLGSIAYNESALLLYESLAAAWIARALRKQAAWMQCMVMAGLFAGFACGVKYTAVPLVLVAFPIAIVAASLLLCALFWLKFTHLMGRFFVPAIPLLAMLLGLLATTPRGLFFSTIIVSLMAIGAWHTLNRAFEKSTSVTDAYSGLFRLHD